MSALLRCEFHLCHQASGLWPTELLSRPKAFVPKMCLVLAHAESSSPQLPSRLCAKVLRGRGQEGRSWHCPGAVFG